MNQYDVQSITSDYSNVGARAQKQKMKYYDKIGGIGETRLQPQRPQLTCTNKLNKMKICWPNLQFL